MNELPPPRRGAPKKAFPLRLDVVLHDVIARLAAQDLRSVNAQIEMLLREAVQRRVGTLPPAAPDVEPGTPSDDGA